MVKLISVIIPSYNEEKNLIRIYKRLVSLSNSSKRYKLKLIFVNDCSTDNSLNIIKKIKARDNNIIIINLKKRYGEWVGFKIGLMNQNSDFVIPLPADLQIPPEIINELIFKFDNNKKIEVIYCVGHPHGNGIFSTLYWNWIFLRFNHRFINAQIDTFFINRKTINLIKDNNKFHNIPPLEIFRSTNYKFISFKKRPRHSGRSKYSLWSEVILFTKTVLLSLNLNIFNNNKPEYELY